jgi:hypothetical protein
MRISISLRRVRRIARWGLLVVLLGGLTFGLYLLGERVTPRTLGQRPILYSPAVRAALDYRGRVEAWLIAIDQIDRSLARLIDETLNTQTGDLYDQSVRAAEMIDRSIRLAQDTTLVAAPSALVDLRQQVIAVGAAYVAAGQAVSILINAPTPASRTGAQSALAAARQTLDIVQSSRWFAQPVAAPQGTP